MIDEQKAEAEREMNEMWELLEEAKEARDAVQSKLEQARLNEEAHRFAVKHRAEFARLGAPGARVKPSVVDFARFKAIADRGFARFQGGSYELSERGRELWDWLEPLM